MSKANKFFLRQNHKQTSVELSKLNREMALKMIMLASETGDVEPLMDAVQAFRSTEELFNQNSAPIEDAKIQKKLGDVLFSIGKNEVNMRALEHSIMAYRGAITIASLLGAEGLRAEVREKYKRALKYAGGDGGKANLSIQGAA